MSGAFAKQGPALTGIAAALLTLLLSATATAAPRPPVDLRVEGGDHWRADGSFGLAWEMPASSPPIAAVHYLVRDPLGATATGPGRLAWRESLTVHVSGGPGIRTVEVWLEDAAGAQGPHADARLQFDPEPPGATFPIQPGGWLSRTELPFAVRMTQPAGPTPTSGVRGYAVAVGRDPDLRPCAAAGRCTDAETDLRGGIGDDALWVDELPEGTNHVSSVAVSGSGLSSSPVGRAVLRVDKADPLTRLEGSPVGWTDRTVKLTAIAADSGSGMVPAGDGEPLTAIAIDGRPPVAAAGSRVEANVIDEGVHTVAYYARDNAGNVDDGGRSNGHANHEPATALVRIDRGAPQVGFVGARYPADPELIEARVADELSGPDPGRGVIAVRPVSSGDPFVALPTESGRGYLRARWSSDDFPTGVYEFRATGYDRAGNVGTTTTRANGSGMTLPNPLKARTSLQALLGGPGRGAERLIGFGRSLTLSGRLSSASDERLDGSVRIVERFDAGASPATRMTTVTAEDEGGFSTALAPGPSREVIAIYEGSGRATRATSERLRVGVRGEVSLVASARAARIGGRPVVFGGSVAADTGSLPKDGVVVELQFAAPGVPWTEFRTVRSNGRGRFRHAYRFSDDDSRGIRFRFRAVVPAQPGWPYEEGASRPIAVRGV